jgi:hypothetical protein
MFGDILGTRLQTVASRNAIVDHVWGAADRGAVPDGFTDNVAVGQLGLSAGQDGVLRFHAPSTRGHYALYVDSLELQNFVENAFVRGRLDDYIEIDSNLTLYYAFANVPVEELDGALGGRIRWVKDFAGPNSSVDVQLPSGQTYVVNKGLRESLTIDSDNDGKANGYDDVPFPDTVIQASVVRASSTKAIVRWLAAPLTTYQLEYSTDLSVGDWSPLQSVSNPEKVSRELVVEDEVPAGAGSRYYRVRYHP